MSEEIGAAVSGAKRPVKLIVQIPCFNEELTLPQTVADIPRQIPGIDTIELLIIDDGSTDRTLEVARGLGIHHIVRNHQNIGLARTFRRGLEACVAAGADVIVNTDGDNQYCGADIPALIRPILDHRAEIVIGDRQTATIAHFSPLKKLLQRVGSHVVQGLAGINVPDTVSGFRAISRGAAQQLNIISSFSYTTEMVIQAGRRGMAVMSVPVRTNAATRESRLFRGIGQFIRRSALTMIRTYAMYKPMRVFLATGLVLTLAGLVPFVRFLNFYLRGEGDGHVQSLIFGGALLSIGFMTFVIGLLADLMAVNRQLLERLLVRIYDLESKLDSSREREGPS